MLPRRFPPSRWFFIINRCCSTSEIPPLVESTLKIWQRRNQCHLHRSGSRLGNSQEGELNDGGQHADWNMVWESGAVDSFVKFHIRPREEPKLQFSSLVQGMLPADNAAWLGPHENNWTTPGFKQRNCVRQMIYNGEEHGGSCGDLIVVCLHCQSCIGWLSFARYKAISRVKYHKIASAELRRSVAAMHSPAIEKLIANSKNAHWKSIADNPGRYDTVTVHETKTIPRFQDSAFVGIWIPVPESCCWLCLLNSSEGFNLSLLISDLGNNKSMPQTHIYTYIHWRMLNSSSLNEEYWWRIW